MSNHRRRQRACCKRISNAFRAWSQRNAEEHKFTNLYSAASEDNIKRLDIVNRSNFMIAILIFIISNFFHQVGNLNHLIDNEKYALVICHWVVTTVLFILVGCYYRTNRKHIWMYEAILIIVLFRNIEPLFEFKEPRVTMYDTSDQKWYFQHSIQ